MSFTDNGRTFVLPCNCMKTKKRDRDDRDDRDDASGNSGGGRLFRGKRQPPFVASPKRDFPLNRLLL